MNDEILAENFTLCSSAEREDSESPFSTNELHVYPSLVKSDVSISLSPSNSLQSSVLDPLKDCTVQISELKRLLEESIRKGNSREVQLQQLQAGKNNCASSEEDTLTFQEPLVESTKELRDCEKHLKALDDALTNAYNNSERMIKRLKLLERPLAVQDKEQNCGCSSEFCYPQRIDELIKVKNRLSSEVEELKVRLQEGDKERKSLAGNNELLQQIEQERQRLHDELERRDKDVQQLSMEVAGFKVKLQEKNALIDELQTEKTTLDDSMLLLREQVNTYDTDFVTERQAREQLVVDNQNLRRQLKEREEQFRISNDRFTTNQCILHDLERENDKLRRQVYQVMEEDEQLRREQQQKDQRLSQLSDQITAELQVKKHVLSENQSLRDELHIKDSQLYELNNKHSLERQQHASETERLKELIYTLEQAADTKHQALLQPSGRYSSSATYGRTPTTNHYSPLPQGSYQYNEKLGSLQTAMTPTNQRRNLYSPTPQRTPPVARQHKEQPSTMPAYSPSCQTELQCPLCARKDFASIKQLEQHAALCSP